MELRVRTYSLAAVLIFALSALAVVTLEVKAASPQDVTKAPASAAAGKAKPEASKPKLGLHVNHPRALQGYTVLAPIMSKKTYLLDMQGRVVRTWESESSSAAMSSAIVPSVSSPMLDRRKVLPLILP